MSRRLRGRADSLKRFVAGLFAAIMFCSATFPVSAQTHVLSSHIPAAVSKLQPLNRLASTKHLDLAIALPLRNREGLTNLLQDIYNPASLSFHHYLTPQQFADQFSPTEQDYQAVKDFAKAHGLTVTETHTNRTLLGVSGSVRDIENTFHVALRIYPHPTESRTFFAPDTDPSVDLAVPILEVTGLSDYFVPRPNWHAESPRAQKSLSTPDAGSGPSGAYIGNDFRAAYVPGVTLDGTGQTVALFQLDGYYPNDPLQYATLTGLTNSTALTTLSNIYVDSFDGSPGFNNVEVALDIEMVMSMAPGSHILVYEGPNSGPGPVHTLNRMATDNLASQLSSSWSIPTGPTTLQIFQQMDLQGQAFFNSSGDLDAYNGPITGPKDVPFITVVGGTTLATSGRGSNWVSETVWNLGGGVGSGGGISTSYAIPNWQQGIDMTSNHGSTVMRNIPDVAMVADNVYTIANNGAGQFLGGTSVAAPLWAAFTSLVNQKAASQGGQPVGFLNPALYAIGKGSNYNTAFHDVTTGNNVNSADTNKFSAVTGYDLCTGWGSPQSTLIDALLTVRFIPTNGWTLAILPFDSWSCVASSADGTKLIAAPAGGQLFVSSTSGATWSGGPSGIWEGVSSSADGTKLAAAEWMSSIFVSVDSGLTWTPSQSPSYSWRSMASSADGTNLASGAFFEDLVDVSTNSGASWQPTSWVPSGAGWMRVAWSADGNVLTGVSGSQIFVSTNWGASGTTSTVPAMNLIAVASSADGSTLVAVGTSAVCISTNLGTGWTVSGMPAEDWSSVTCSADGRTIVAVSSSIFVSTDAGTTWTNISPINANWRAVACSADGSRLIAAHQSATGGQVWTGFFPTSPSIWSQPVTQTAQYGLAASFNVRASGTWPLSYQWFFGGTPLSDGNGISGSTTSNLTIQTLAFSNGGDYTVVVGNPYGSTNSIPATLTVQVTNPPVFSAVAVLPDGTVQGTVNGFTGAISIEASTNLVDWVTVTNFVLTNSPVQFIDPSATNYPQRFYRVRIE